MDTKTIEIPKGKILKVKPTFGKTIYINDSGDIGSKLADVLESSKNIPDTELYIEPYYKEGITKSFLVKGNTRQYKDALIEFGGKWNSSLVGWIFSNKHLEELTDYVNKINKEN